MNRITISIILILIWATLGFAAEDEFNDQVISTAWVERNGTGGSFSEANGILKITSSSGDTFGAGFDPAYLHQPVSGDFDVYIKVEAPGIDDNYETAGIIFRLDDGNWVSCGLLSIVSSGSATTFNRIDTNNKVSDAMDLPSGTGGSPCWLRMKRVGSDFNCYYALSLPTVNEDWIEIPPPNTKMISSSEGRIGIYAKHSGGGQFVGSFDYFRNFVDGTPNGAAELLYELNPVRNFRVE